MNTAFAQNHDYDMAQVKLLATQIQFRALKLAQLAMALYGDAEHESVQLARAIAQQASELQASAGSGPDASRLLEFCDNLRQLAVDLKKKVNGNRLNPVSALAASLGHLAVSLECELV